MAKKRPQPIASVPPENKTMSIHMVKGGYPPFHELGEYTFQDLSAELFAEEPGIIAASVYGTRGQKQYGIDIRAESETDEIEVGQCKRYQTFSQQNMIDASNEFFEYWDTHWKSKKVRRFILFVACRVTDPQTIDEIEQQKIRFNQHGMRYELWGAEKLEKKLRPHRQIVSKFCDPSDYWVETICRIKDPAIHSKTSSQTQAEISVNLTFISQFAELASQTAEKELQEIHALWQQGNEKDARSRLEQLKSDTKIWTNASPELKAQILCFIANIDLETGEDISAIEELLNEAHSYAQVINEKRVRALLLVRGGKLDEALSLLGNEDDVDTANIRAGLLLDAGQDVPAIRLLSELITKGTATAETYHLMALANLSQGDVALASKHIEYAKQKKPDWFRIHFVEGMIAYYQALSPIALPPSLAAFPLPIDWMLIKQDEGSIASIRRAEKIFTQLSKLHMQKEKYFPAWRLSCLFSDAERQEEAIALCTSLLISDPAYFPALAWAVSRRLDIDLKPSIKLLEKEISDPNVPINNILTLISLYEYTERVADGLDLFEATRDHFKEQNALPTWTTNYIRLLASSNNNDEIEGIAADLPEGEEYLLARSFITSYRATLSGQWDEFIIQQLGLFQETQKAEFLLNACMALYRNKKWEEFAQYADTLIEKIGTAEIYRKVILGIYNAHQYERCLILLEKWEQEFYIEKTHQEYHQIRFSCFYALGDYEKALSEAKTLVDNNPSITNTLNLINLLYELGNYDEVAVYAKSLKDVDLPPETLLHLAYLLRGNHTTIAQLFWRKAVANELPDEYIGSAIDLAFKLELDHDIGNLFQRLLSYDRKEERAIQQFQTWQEVTQTFDSLRQKNAEYENAYYSGVLPIHFYAEGLNLTFSDLFHHELKEKKGDELVWSRPLYIRYGGKPLMDGFPQPIDNLRLFVDVSALLLAAHLDVLDAVEQAFAPLYIPSQVFASLTSMVDRTYHHQPSVIEANKAIMRLVSRKKLKVASPPQSLENVESEIAELNSEWRECFELAKTRGGYFLTFLPPTKLGEVYISESVHLTVDIERHLINCHTLADALRDKEELTKDHYTAVLEGLGTLAAVYPNTQQPRQQDFIICDDAIINSLARTGLLEHACNVFDVHITQRRFEIAQGATSWDADREESRKWIQALQERLRTGLQDRRYIALPVKDDGDADERANTTSSVLLALIKHAKTLQETGMVWIDDRYSNHYNQVGKASFVGIVDVLKLLVGKQVLSPESYYERLIQLRAGNVRFIPLQSDELLHHLKNALKEKDGNYWVEDTRSLTVIRRSIAACIANRKDIQLPPMPEQIMHQQGEVEFILSLHHVIQQTLHEIWLSVTQPEAREALAEWLIVHLYLDYPSLILREKEQRPIDQPDYYRAGAQLTSFLSLAYFQLRDEEGTDIYQHYIKWVVSRIIGRRLHTEPELLEASANVSKQTLMAVKNENMKEYPEEIVGIIIHRSIRSMPYILQSKIESDDTFLKQLGVETYPIITLGDLHFERDEFWQAVETVVNGGKKAIRTTNIDAVARFSLHEENGQIFVVIDHPQKDEQIGLTRLEFRILKSSPEERRQFLTSQRHTFDCSDSEFQQIVDELQSIGDPAQRVLRLLSLWSESAATIYRDLAINTQLNKHLDMLSLTDLSFQSLKRYLRLETGSDEAPVTQSIDQGAAQLIQELGIEPTFYRFSGLPLPLPKPLIDALDAMPTSEREELLKRRIRSPRSIPSTIHLLWLLYRYQADTQVLKEAVNHIAEELCGEAARIKIEAFLALLVWVHRQFLLRTEFAGLSTQLKIVVTWTHTHHLFTMMKAGNIDFAWIKDAFANEARQMSVEVLLQDKAYRSDIAHPRFVSYERLVLTGLLYAVNGETSLLPAHLIQRVIDLSFPLAGERRLPALFLSLNSAFLTNVSNSFLTRNMGEVIAPLVEGLQPKQFTNEALTHLIDQFIARIRDDEVNEEGKKLSWALLHSAVQDIPLPIEISERLTELFLTLDWVHLFATQHSVWRTAFILAVIQYPSLRNETLKRNLQSTLLEIAKICGEMEQTSSALDSTKGSETVGALLQGAIQLAVDHQSGKVVLETFSNMVIEMAWHWKYLGTESNRVVRVMCEDLPLPYAQQLLSTLVMLRAM